MRQFAFILIMLLLLNCNSQDRKNIGNPTPKTKEASQTTADKNADSLYVAYCDSLLHSIDTATLKGKRAFILERYLLDRGFQPPDFDTAIDLTYDGYIDYVIGSSMQAATGLINRIEVYIYNKTINTYFFDEHLSGLLNPTFYINKKKITSFYIANGSGEGQRLEWINGKWITTKKFSVDNQEDTSKWEISYPLTKKKEIIIRSYQMIPPDDVLETNVH